MNKLELHIDIAGQWHSLDMDKSTRMQQVLQASDYNIPTLIKNTFSKPVSLPMTRHNNNIFRQVYRLDSNSLDFDTLIRTPFRLYINQSLYETGYFKMEEINRDTYTIRLYGGLGDFFFTMNEQLLTDLYSDGDIFRHQVDKNKVTASFTGQPFNNASGNDMSSYFGYAMTYQGTYENFDNTKLISAGDTQSGPVEWWNTVESRQYSVESDITEHGRIDELENDGNVIIYGEYRSYYQKPMIKFATLFQHILDRMNSEHGWTTDISDSFFSDANPYWSKLWLLMDQYKTQDVVRSSDPVSLTIADNTISGSSVFGSLDVTLGNEIALEPGKAYTGNYTLNIQLQAVNVATPSPVLIKTSPLSFTFTVYVIDGVNSDIASNFIFNAVSPEVAQQIAIPQPSSFFYKNQDGGDVFQKEIKFSIPAEMTEGMTAPRIKLVASYSGSTYWFGSQTQVDVPAGAKISLKSGSGLSIYYDKSIRSHADINWSDIMQSENTWYDLFISYCKMFDLKFIKDPIAKNVKIVSRNSFYSNRQVVDWTYKFDRSKDYISNPTPFEYRTGIFKYNDLESKYEEQYKSSTNREYGFFRFDNGNQFGTDEVDYIEDILFDNLINAYDYSRYYFGKGGNSFKDNKFLPHLQDSEGGKIDLSMALVFKNGVVQTEQQFAVTDDTPNMIEYGYCWTNDTNYMNMITSYPNILRTLATKDANGNVTNAWSLNFGNPAIYYNDEEGAAEQVPQNNIYERFWKDYLNDRFSRNNKLLKANFILTVNDLKDVFRKFIMIDNTLWVVNKIDNFDYLNDTNIVECELINVQDIDNYISQTWQ